MAINSINFCVELFDRPIDGVMSSAERYRSEQLLKYLGGALVGVDTIYRRTKRGGYPSVYQAGIKYEREESGREDWKATPVLFRDGVGDCEDLAADVVALLRTEKIKADFWIDWTKLPNGRMVYHALAWRETATRLLPPGQNVKGKLTNRGLQVIRELNGKPTLWKAPSNIGGFIEDPSRALGM